MSKRLASVTVEGWWWWRGDLTDTWQVVFCAKGKIYTTGRKRPINIPYGEFWEPVYPPTKPPQRLIPFEGKL